MPRVLPIALNGGRRSIRDARLRSSIPTQHPPAPFEARSSVRRRAAFQRLDSFEAVGRKGRRSCVVRRNVSMSPCDQCITSSPLAFGERGEGAHGGDIDERLPRLGRDWVNPEEQRGVAAPDACPFAASRESYCDQAVAGGGGGPTGEDEPGHCGRRQELPWSCASKNNLSMRSPDDPEWVRGCGCPDCRAAFRCGRPVLRAAAQSP